MIVTVSMKLEIEPDTEMEPVLGRLEYMIWKDASLSQMGVAVVTEMAVTEVEGQPVS